MCLFHPVPVNFDVAKTCHVEQISNLNGIIIMISFKNDSEINFLRSEIIGTIITVGQITNKYILKII